jgi:hypothetical protein
MYPRVGIRRIRSMDRRDLLVRIARGRTIAVTGGWAALSRTSLILARTAGFLARCSGQLAMALRAVRGRLGRLALRAQARASSPAAQASVVIDDPTEATIVSPLPPVVPGLPRVPPPPGALASRGVRLPPPPSRSKPPEGALRS